MMSHPIKELPTVPKSLCTDIKFAFPKTNLATLNNATQRRPLRHTSTEVIRIYRGVQKKVYSYKSYTEFFIIYYIQYLVIFY